MSVKLAASGLCLLLALIAATRGDDAVARCTQTDVTTLRDTLRQSACRLKANRTEGEAFRAAVRAKHGLPDASSSGDFFAFASLFVLTTAKAWCRSTCPDIAPENVTWCVQIAYPERNVEVCLRPGADHPVVVNISCEAELVALPDYLSFPEECAPFGGVGCLGLSNLDWFFQEAYLTCIVTTDTCSEKSFTQLLTHSSVAQPPEFDLFPTSPHVVRPSDTMILHAEISTTTERIIIAWQHDDKLYSDFIFEDPFCNPQLEECYNDTHPEAPSLRQQRIRTYRTTRDINLDGCQTSRIYRLECYLIIDKAGVEDSGEYNLNMTVTYPGFAPISVSRSVNASIECQPQPFEATCSHSIFSAAEGASAEWECRLTAPPATNFTLLLNKTTAILPSKPGLKCGKEPQVMFFIEEEAQHVCFSGFNVTVVVCSASEGVVGEFTILSSSGEVSMGTKVIVKLEPDEPTVGTLSTIEDSKSGPVSPVIYAAPLSALVVVLGMLLLAVVMVLRRRKRRREVRITARMQSPSLKEAAFFKEEEALHSCPASPLIGNGILEDPLEFPRNRLYIYSNKVLGEGSFGRVLQAKAEGIVPGMPDRNMVAIKTTKENATSVEREELLAELHLMREMEPHENILNLLGQCTTGGGPVCLIVEFATYGNLRDFLRQCEEVVLSLNHLPHIPRNRSRTRTFSASSCGSAQPLIVRQDSVFTPSSGHTHFVFPSPNGHASSGSGSSGSGEGKLMAHHPDTAPVPLAHSVTPIGHDYINTKGLVYMEDVHNFALQIACGLQHLANMQIVHCDLAARNVLIAEGFVLKIADFGLARDISGRDLYKKNPRGKIPVKWTAPEALEHRTFTVSSDVWSYGVLLWELFTYGHTPYPEVNLGASYEPFISYLKAGNRMQQPESCPASFYELMLQCWQLEPGLRPAPHDLVAQLTPDDSIFDDTDSQTNTGPQVGSNKSDSTGSEAGHQSSQE